MDLAVKLLAVILLVGTCAFGQTVPASRPVFVMDGKSFVPWGFNYDRDFKLRLIEDYWETEWPTVEQDFREMKQLGANIVRVHLQFGRFMDGPEKINEKSLARLAALVKLAEETGLYLDLTGLGCYRKTDVPAWYDQLPEQQRWDQQARFWETIASRCAKSPAIFCYDLINEPVVPVQKVDTWLDPHELAGFSYVQFIVKDLRGRKREDVARAWVHQMCAAIRKRDPNRLITIGMLPFPGAGGGSGFDPRDMASELDFFSVHIYPASGKLDESLNLLADFASHGKPVVVEEIFPLAASAVELEQFIRDARARGHASGWIGFYWGQTPDELRQSNEIIDRFMLSWLDLFQKLGPELTGTRQGAATSPHKL